MTIADFHERALRCVCRLHWLAGVLDRLLSCRRRLSRLDQGFGEQTVEDFRQFAQGATGGRWNRSGQTTSSRDQTGDYASHEGLDVWDKNAMKLVTFGLPRRLSGQSARPRSKPPILRPLADADALGAAHHIVETTRLRCLCLFR